MRTRATSFMAEKGFLVNSLFTPNILCPFHHSSQPILSFLCSLLKRWMLGKPKRSKINKTVSSNVSASLLLGCLLVAMPGDQLSLLPEPVNQFCQCHVTRVTP
jgi:hypothetical protein